MRLVRIRSVVGPELHDVRAVLDDAAGSVVELALHAVDDVGHGHVDPLALGHDRRHLVAVLGLVAPLLGFHHRHQQGLGGVRVLVDPGRAHGEGLLRVVLPELAGGDGGVADALVDELLVPRLADAEAVHRADLHVRHHLGRGHDDGLDVLVGVDAAGGEPVADPEVVSAAREGHRRLHRLARRLLGLQHGFERLGVEPDLVVDVLLGDRDALTVQVEPGHDVHRHGHVVLRHPARRDQVGHRAEDVGAVDAVALGAEHEVVAGGAPACLLQHLRLGQAVLGEDALLLGHEERRRVGQRDEAELGPLHLRPRALREGARRQRGAGRTRQCERGGRALEDAAAGRVALIDAHPPCVSVA